ncbi:MAG: hypothetical protein GXC76_00765 [Rhodanobacteraceae bacterium]|nr:hypothetical protein [Rhodanobacteraceae bacterium]
MFLFLTLPLAACQSPGATRSSVAPPAVAAVPLAGQFDNHAQVWSARESAAAIAPAHVVVTVEPTPQADWSLWRIRLDATPALEATWAMHHVGGANGAGLLLPHRALLANPADGAAFDARQWAPLEACALRGSVAAADLRVAADSPACAALVPGLGPAAALLPLAVEREGEWLRLRLYADQARGADARTDVRKVEVFGGWAALNGAGPNAAADSKDWHMDRALRLGSEGGRVTLKWRDGKPSGYSLVMERLTYRDGNVPVLKLSVIDDRSGSTLAYAWANPEASRIGLSLGWVQVGLEREAAAAR